MESTKISAKSLHLGHASKTLIVLFLIVSLVFLATAQQEEENELDVEVEIAEETIIDIQPSEFSWGGGNIFPGERAGPEEEQVGNFGRIQIENLGSVDIDEVFFRTTSPDTRPFGTGDINNYDSGNFIGLNHDIDNSGPNQFVDRTEYGLSQPDDQDIIYLDTPDEYDYGRFRNTSFNYFWTVDDTGTSLDGAEFRIGIDHQNDTQTGSTDLSDECRGGDEDVTGGNDCNGYFLDIVTDDNGNDWAVTPVEIGAVDENPGTSDGGDVYCVAMEESQVLGDDQPELEFIKWNKGHPAISNVGDGSPCDQATDFAVGDDAEFDNIVPGDWITMDIRANIPFGVASGDVPTGNLVAVARSQ